MTDHPKPQDNPDCLCKESESAVYFCPFGHSDGCHYPKTCQEADCQSQERDDADDE